MGKEKKRIGRGPLPGGHAKERHRKSTRSGSWNAAAPTTLNARPEAPGLKSKHHSYFELVENKDKKKKLEFKITSDRQPPPGFEFVPIGNPELTTACKELSREQDALIFIISTDKRAGPASLSHQVNRIGHHIRQTIVEQARASIGDSDVSSLGQHLSGLPEPIPVNQEDINEQADKAIRDLFPRIPNTDRQTIIEHSFKKGATKKGEPLVGLAKDITLSRRVQLAVLAHIRHTHTRYDRLLKETTYANARKTVEALCLDILVKWRGDEETGRDQLDEILREVIVISDSESEEDGYTSDTGSSQSDDSVQEISRPVEPARDSPVVAFGHFVLRPPAVDVRQTTEAPAYDSAQSTRGATVSTYLSAPSQTFEPIGVKKGRRGFRRYQAALLARWDEAKTRVRLQEELPDDASGTLADRPDSQYGPPQQDPSYALEPACCQEVQAGDPSADYGPRRLVAHPPAIHGGYPAYAYDQQPVQFAGPLPGMRTPPMPHRVFSHPLSRNNSPRVGPGHQLNQRTTVRSEEVRDYLVPSIEPASPTGQSDSSVPILVRTFSPRPGARESHHGEAQARYDTHHSPSWREDSYGNVKHRRVTSESTFIRLPSRQGPHPGYVAREDHHGQGAVPYAETSLSASSAHTHSQEDYRQAPARPLAQPASGMQAYHSYGSMRPVVADDWPVHAPPQHAPQVGMTPVPHPYQENIPLEPHGAEARREMYRRYDGNPPESGPVGGYEVSHPQSRWVGDGMGRRQSLKRAADGTRLDGENRYPYDPHMASRPLGYPHWSNHDPAGLAPRYAEQASHPGSALPASAVDAQPDAPFLRRADNAWSYHRITEVGPPGGPSRDTRDLSAYDHGHPPLPPDVHVIRSYPDNLGQQYMSRHTPHAPDPPPFQGWTPHTSYR